MGERIHKNFGRKTLLHQFITEITTSASPAIQSHSASLLVERLGVGGGGSDVGIARSLVGAGLLLKVLGSGQVGGAGLLVGSLVSTSGGDEVSDGGGEGGEHLKEYPARLNLLQHCISTGSFHDPVQQVHKWRDVGEACQLAAEGRAGGGGGGGGQQIDHRWKSDASGNPPLAKRRKNI